ncbi:hypothetical protein HYFRA_00012220 [Hymenoscyphus fraxineus]|uniref:Uncharacterized protein n=1 Tax=Hymenoscyphus fraxineus TaxID=746836 RepID=A0A9N9PRA3_9HELO|nr:hypothetical protein HYFRA_00012220 [Hymenoscyphus fraxineus]
MHLLSSFEKFLIATAFWASINIFGRLVRFFVQILDSVVSSVTPKQIDTLALEHSKYAGFGWGSLLFKIMATCLIHQAANFCLDTIVPLWEEFNRDGERVQRRVQARVSQSFGGFRELNKRLRKTDTYEGDRKMEKEPKVSANTQLISFERHKLEDQKERTLDWDIVIGKGALDEMKETLGPPGGFGELGFVVEQDGVSFQAMGVGTKFNLRFSVREEPGVQVSKN